MPETDVELFAVTGFTAAMANVEKTYDGKTAKLEVVTEGEGYTFTYAWKKDGVATGDTGSFIEVANVSDSGAYTCMITGTGEHGDVYTKEVTANVAIAKAANSVSNPTMEGWTYGDAANEPSATATFGTVAYRYYNETETLLDGVPANAGTYFVKAYVAADANGNYDAAESELVKFTVAKAANSVTVTVSGWTYDGTAHQATATAAHGTPVITYYAEDDTPLTAAPVNAGNYYVVASVAATDNYTAAEATQDFTVAKRGLDFANAEWNSLSFTYDKSEKSVTFDKDAVVIADFTGTLDFGFAYKETGYTYRATDAGSYKAGFTYDVVNFAAANLGEKADTLWNIAKAQIIVDKDALDVSITQTGAEPSDNLEVPYNGKEYAVSVSAPEGVTVTMSGEYKKTAAGSYVAVATFSLKDGKNYTLSCDTEMEIEWKIKETVTPPDRTHEALDGKVSVTDGTGAADGYELTASDVTATLGDVDLSAALEEGQKGTVKAAYDIHFEDGGTEKPVTGNFSVKLLIPENLRSAENLMVVHIADDGTVTAMDATRNGNYMEFTAEHFSVYAIVQTEADAPASMWWLYVLIAVIVIIIIIVIILLLRKKKDNGDDGEPAPEEEPAKELAEEPAEEAEETAEEPEQPAEEATEEEAPVPEEEPAEEPEVPEEEPESEPEEGDGADMNGALFVAAADADKREVFDRSYFSRLAQAEDELKDYYYALRAKLLSYRKMTNRVSWNYESFNRGRMQCVKLKIRGKSLVMYIALDPKELNVNKYHHQDVSETAKYAEVPTMMKIRSPRGLKYAMELVDLLLGQKLNLGVKKMQPEAVEIPYASDETLLEQGYIKVQYTTFGFGKKN
ncbi:MAG: hypothetical protein DBX59_03200 [Bacillota bacterium]|nr:MAG: hypothetical protein DBX59_03200 [Bacillota bacterium]